MIILSFDVGIINLAYCIFNSNTCKILNWGIIDLKVSGFTAKVPSGKASIAKAANDIHITLIKELDALPFLLNVDYVVIEKQPSFNPKMRIIGGCLQTYFYIRGIVDNLKITSIEFFSPKHKLKCYTGPEIKLESKVKSKYSQTKKTGVVIAKLKLNELNEKNEFKLQFENSKKKDDLADCYLQAITFCLFKKFKSLNEINEVTIEPILIEPILTKIEIKRQLKEYLEINENFDNILPILKKSIFNKFGLTDLNDLSFLDKLSMKTYKRRIALQTAY